MKCQNCGGEIKAGSKFCEYCGAQITVEMRKELEQINKAGCPKCGSSNIVFGRETQGAFRDKNGSTAVVRSTVGVCKDCGFTWSTQGDEQPKERKTWLWVLGWIFCFPIPVMVLIWRKKCTWDIKVKIGVTIGFWILLFILAGVNKTETNTPVAETQKEETVSTQTVEKTKTVEKTETVKETETEPEPVEITATIEPNVNEENGKVLFNVITNLPEDTKLSLTLVNNDGYYSKQTVTILNNGTGYTSEFDDDSYGLNGDFTAMLTDGKGNIITTSDFTFEYEVVKLTLGQKNAIEKAKHYLSFTAFSESGLIDQLEFEGFTTEEATFAVENCGADWNEQAMLKAQSYLDLTSFSKQGLIEQLEFEGFTPEQAEYGVTAVGY